MDNLSTLFKFNLRFEKKKETLAWPKMKLDFYFTYNAYEFCDLGKDRFLAGQKTDVKSK